MKKFSSRLCGIVLLGIAGIVVAAGLLKQRDAKLAWFSQNYKQLYADYLETRRHAEMRAGELNEVKLACENLMEENTGLKIAMETASKAPVEPAADHAKVAELEGQIQFLTAELDSLQKAAVDFPKFPWPPPRASSSMTVPVSRFGGKYPHYGDLDDAVCGILDVAGYTERGYFWIPGGYAVATRLEQYNADGSPMNSPDRWNVDGRSNRVFSLKSYLQALLAAPPGRYRVIVFTVSDEPYRESDKSATQEQAVAWTSQGLNSLPKTVAAAPLPSRSNLGVLVYEFEKTQVHSASSLKTPGRLDVPTHLKKSHISVVSL